MVFILSTYHVVAFLHGLSGNNYFEMCSIEAITHQMHVLLSRLFDNVLILCSLTNSRSLWANLRSL